MARTSNILINDLLRIYQELMTFTVSSLRTVRSFKAGVGVSIFGGNILINDLLRVTTLMTFTPVPQELVE